MPRFTDDNTLEDIQGCILVASSWPNSSLTFDIHEELAELEERIQDKLARNRNRIRHNWFTNALQFIHEAQESYRNGKVEHGRKLLRLAWEQIESGNKAHRRKTRFIGGENGQITEQRSQTC
jgi:hypothetical protein